MRTDEQWRPVPGWCDLYEVSNHGRVRSLDRVSSGTRATRRIKGRILRPGTTPKGYAIVILCRDSQRLAYTVHGLVAAAFLGPRPSGMHVCHGDDDPQNNHLTNLRYDTPSNNNLDVVNHGRHPNAVKTHCPQGHLYDAANTIWERNATQRKCRACHRDRTRARRALARAS